MKKVLLVVAVPLLILGAVNFVYAQQYNYNNTNKKGTYLGQLSNNRYNSQSTGNPYGQYGGQYSPQSIKNPHGQYGSPYSPKSVNNPYTTDAPKLYSKDGKYLGKVSSNQYDPDSISNPNGRYGSKYSPDSVNNPNGQYGSPYSSQSVNNPYAANASVIIYGNGNSSGVDQRRR